MKITVDNQLSEASGAQALQRITGQLKDEPESGPDSGVDSLQKRSPEQPGRNREYWPRLPAAARLYGAPGGSRAV